VRGLYHEGYVPSGKPERIRSRDEFPEDIAAGLGQKRPLGADDAAQAVFKVLGRHISKGELDEVKQSLPKEGRVLFP
jgi:uncharacterized protein (DUF2267 family)